MLVERTLLSTIYGVNEERRLPCIDSVMLCSLFFRFLNGGECRCASEVNFVETMLIALLKYYGRCAVLILCARVKLVLR